MFCTTNSTKPACSNTHIFWQQLHEALRAFRAKVLSFFFSLNVFCSRQSLIDFLKFSRVPLCRAELTIGSMIYLIKFELLLRILHPKFFTNKFLFLFICTEKKYSNYVILYNDFYFFYIFLKKCIDSKPLINKPYWKTYRNHLLVSYPGVLQRTCTHTVFTKLHAFKNINPPIQIIKQNYS